MASYAEKWGEVTVFAIYHVGNGLDRSEAVGERADWSRPVPTWRGAAPMGITTKNG